MNVLARPISGRADHFPLRAGNVNNGPVDTC